MAEIRNATTIIWTQASTAPRKVAVLVGERGVTFQELAHAVAECARHIAAAEVAADAVAAVQISDPLRHWVATLAAMHLGLPTVAMAGAIVLDEQAKMNLGLIVSDGSARPGPLAPGCRRIAAPPPFAPSAVAESAASLRPAHGQCPARIVMSSGTTGSAKPVVLEANAIDEPLSLYSE